MDMGKPPFKASDGGRIDRSRELEEITQNEFQLGPGNKCFLHYKVRPEAFPNGSPMSIG